MTLYLLRWPHPLGERRPRESATTLAPNAGAAFVWLVRQRPALLADPAQITVQPWRQIAAGQR